jgi:glycerophosphoryl diester phosphodiesterase
MRSVTRPLVLATAVVAAALAGPMAEALASPYIQAHRGGPVVRGEPTFPESTMPAFRFSAEKGFILEFDTKLTQDDVPVVFHDATLDRATDCEGRIDQTTLAELTGCRVDILGTEAQGVELEAGDPRAARIPTLERVLRFLERSGTHASIEIKNVPTDADFDATDAFAQRVMDEIAASGVPPSNLIIQSFWPPNLEVAEETLPEAERALLSLAQTNDGAAAFAAANEIEWVSPQWPAAQTISPAHAVGRRVVPYTIDNAPNIAEATEAGVDAIISNDPLTARATVRSVVGPRPKIPPAPTRKECAATRASTHLRPIVARSPAPRAPRMFAMQFKQDIANVVTYDAFRTKIECMVRQYVANRRARHRPNVVAFNEDIGLMTIATGSRGAPAREIFASPETAPSCEPQGAPCGALGALAAITAQYGPQTNSYLARFPGSGALETAFVAPTDTFARGWMQVFSDMARRYRIYILGSNTQAPFRESRDPSEIALFSDPDLPEPESVYVATEGNAYNEVFMWGPQDVRKEGPRPLQNVVAQNRKVPLTALEEQLEISPGASTGPDAVENVAPYRLPGTKAKIGFATSLPAFVFGHGFAEPPPEVDPCSDTSLYYMRCMDKLGVNLVIQDEANPGRWGATQPGGWQPLEWMSSSWRHVADPSVSFDYNVTPFMVGHLADIVFDGQSSIAQRGAARTRGCNYVATRRFRPGPPENDPAPYEVYAGRKDEFIAIAPWVRKRGSRDKIRETAAKLAPGSGDPLENDYVETAIVADLPFPVETDRRGCVRR